MLAGAPSEQIIQMGSISAGHPGPLKVWIRKAAQKPVPVVCVVTDAPGTERLTAVSTDSFVSGAMVAELLQLIVRGFGTVSILTGDLSTLDHSEKVRGFKKSIDALSGSLTISSVVETHDDEAEAYNAARELLTHDHSLKAIDVSTAKSIRIMQALEELDPELRVALVTTDLFSQLVRHETCGARNGIAVNVGHSADNNSGLGLRCLRQLSRLRLSLESLQSANADQECKHKPLH